MTKITKIKHVSHEHRLKLKRSSEPYNCNGCDQPGFGTNYQCNKMLFKCNFHLHEECASASADCSENHPFFKKSNLIFHDYKSRAGPADKPHRFCVACGKHVGGFGYQSMSCSKARIIHPCCLKLPLTLPGDHDQDAGQVVSLRLLKKAKYWSTSKCLRCQKRKISKKIHGWVYVSTSGDFCYHVACVQDLILDKWKTSQHQDSNGDPGRLTLQLAIEHNKSRKKVRQIQMVLKVALHLLINAILGEAVGGIIDLIF